MVARALFVSPCQPIAGCSPDVYTWDKRARWPFAFLTFLNHPGLSWLAANAGVEVLEYPDWPAFERALADPPEVLGISFYLNETEVALRMAAAARAAGVREVWAGNFGAYSPQIAQHFDRIVTGWGERQVAEALGRPIAPDAALVHPEMYTAFGARSIRRAVLSGMLFTSRGCPYTCNFCQTPSFYGKSQPVELAAIDRVLWTYARNGVQGINILDENFGTFRKHAGEVVRLLHKHGLRWIALTRVDTLTKNFDDWAAHGLFGAHLGIESLNVRALDGAVKRIDDQASVALLRRMSRHNMFAQLFYMIGFPEDTAESVRADIRRLAALDFDVAQIQVLTPYPRTDQTAEIERTFGIQDRNLSRYNSRNLVWDHPNISVAEMRELQRWANATIATPRRTLRAFAKFAVFHGRPRPNLEGLRKLAGLVAGPGVGLQRRHADKLAAARAWAAAGWHAYEEVPHGDSVTATETLQAAE